MTAITDTTAVLDALVPEPPRPASRAVGTEPAPVPDLAALTRNVLATADGTMRSRRAARRLTGGPGRLQQTVVALCDHQRLDDHACSDAATLQVLHGRVVLDSGGQRILLEAGAWTPVPADRHHLESVGDAVVLITTAPAADPTRHRAPFVR
jgi:quercetin dioxygenase-like cupin family protein